MGADYEDDEPTGTSTAEIPPDEDLQLCAQISVDGIVSVRALPAAGSIGIGRGSGCDVVIEHPSVSRQHATLQLAPLQIMDQNSRNGTRLRGEALEPGVAVPFAIGEAVQLGHVTILIDR